MTATDPAVFLRQQLPLQQANVQSHMLGSEQVWLKKAGPRHGMARYRLLGLLAWMTQLPLLRPVPNLGGSAAIATEAQRLRKLAALGLRVPRLLAECPEGLLLQHLGRAGEPTPSLDGELHAAQAQGPQAVQAVWQDGLHALGLVHAQGGCLSQAFARNLVRCPDGVIGYIDFEDNPAAALPLALCQARDLLCYVHSSALYLREGGAWPGAQALWQQWLGTGDPAVARLVADSARRLAWLRHLPPDRRLGRDLQRARAAYDLLAQTPA